MSYIGTMMEAQAVIYRPTVGIDNRHGVVLDPFVPVDPETGGPAANRLEPDPIPCSVQQAGPRELKLYGQRNSEFNTTLIFAQNPHCQIDDQIRVTDLAGNVTYYLAVGAAVPIARGMQWIVTANHIQHPVSP